LTAIGYYMAVIEIVEFLATTGIKPLIKPDDWDVIVNVSLYSYAIMIIVKFFVLAWLVFSQWRSKVGAVTKIV
jgi:hypothetical protein